jgi:hypothetical protein
MPLRGRHPKNTVKSDEMDLPGYEPVWKSFGLKVNVLFFALSAKNRNFLPSAFSASRR